MTRRRRIAAVSLIAVGAAFLLWAIFGRYLVLPGFLESLATGEGSTTAAPPGVEAWRVARFLIWAFSFKIGVLLITLAAFLRAGVTQKRFLVYIAVGLVYLSIAYMPLAAPGIVFGIGGVAMTVLIVWTLLRASIGEAAAPSPLQRELRLWAYFFFATAAYMLCGIFGTRIFALQPEKMIEYGLQEDAMTFALHVLIELIVAWALLLTASDRRRTAVTAGADQPVSRSSSSR